MANKEVRRDEYSSSNVVRTLHPSRPLSPVRRNVEYNNNNLGEPLLKSIIQIEKNVFLLYEFSFCVLMLLFSFNQMNC